jgi:membrane peptidoglycan carboxypeptidase
MFHPRNQIDNSPNSTEETTMPVMYDGRYAGEIRMLEW